MLLEFRVKNFRSFKEEQMLSLVPSSDPSLANNIFESGQHKALKTTALFGPNASGKTNLVKAVDFFVEFIAKSTNQEFTDSIPSILSFQLDKESREQPSEFEAVFVHNEIRYQYGFALTSERIEEEWLYAFPLGRPQTWFTREYNPKKKDYEWKFGPNLKGGKSRYEIKSKTRNTTLYLSAAAQWNNQQLLSIYDWITVNIRTILTGQHPTNVTTELLLDQESEPELRQALKNLIVECIRTADLGIENLIVRREKIDEIKVKFPKDMPESLRNKILNDMKENPPVSTNCLHSTDDGQQMILPLNEESDGTIKLYQLLGPLLETIAYGYTVFIDELESSLHPLLMSILLKMVTDFSEGSGQVIFTTHSTNLLKSDLLRRDQVWFTEKVNNGSTKLYPLSDYMPRKGEAIEKNYLSGRYGAVPILKEFGING